MRPDGHGPDPGWERDAARDHFLLESAFARAEEERAVMTLVAWLVVGLAGGTLVLALVIAAKLLRAIAAAPAPIWAALGLAAVAAGAAWRAGHTAGDLPDGGARPRPAVGGGSRGQGDSSD